MINLSNMLPNSFLLQQSKSPTYYNLSKYLKEQGWHETKFNLFANFSEKNFQFNDLAAQRLEFKHLLADIVKQYCQYAMPETYYIDDENWQLVLEKIADKYYMKDNQILDQVDNLVWILKPSLLNNGQNIKIFKYISDIEQHYICSKRLGGEHVLQQYITQPHLFKDRKYSIRMFVIVTNYAGIYLYPYGYFNVALSPYRPNEYDVLSSHITNEHLKEHESNVMQMPTQEFDFFPSLYPQIKTIVTDTTSGLHHLHPEAFVCRTKRTVAIFGFDFMVDINRRVWLLEANHGPCFPIADEHPLQKNLYYNFWQSFISSFVIPIAKHQSPHKIQYQYFESVGE